MKCQKTLKLTKRHKTNLDDTRKQNFSCHSSMVIPGHTHPSGLERNFPHVLMQNILCIWISVEVALAERPIIM